MSKEIEFQLELLAIDIRELWNMYENSDNYDLMDIAFMQKKVEKMEGNILDELGFAGKNLIDNMKLEKFGKKTFS